METRPKKAIGDAPARPIAAALAVVVRDNRVILVRRANPPDVGLWGFPGGKIEHGERIADAAVRELSEETAVAARAIEVFTAVDAIEQSADASIAHHYALIAVLCQWVSGEPAAHDDALDARWFDVETLLSARTVKSFDVATVAVQALSLAGTRARGRDRGKALGSRHGQRLLKSDNHLVCSRARGQGRP